MSSPLEAVAIAYALLEEQLLGENTGGKGYRSIVVDREGVSGEAFTVSGDGVVEEAVLVSSDKRYRVLLETGDGEVVHGSWSELSSVSQYLGFIDAFEDNGKYIVRIAGVGFRGYARLVVLDSVVDRVVAKILVPRRT